MSVSIQVESKVEFAEILPATDLLRVGQALALQVRRRAAVGVGSAGQPLTTPLRRTNAPYAGDVDAQHPFLGVAPQDEAVLDRAIDEMVTKALNGGA